MVKRQKPSVGDEAITSVFLAFMFGGLVFMVAGCAFLANRTLDHAIGTDHVVFPHEPQHEGDRP